jgi:uncharacterized lipoprotein YmbA
MKAQLSILLFALIACAGCASSQPEQKTEYLLRPQTTSVRDSAQPTIGLGRVEVAPYLDHEGIALETRPGEINIAEHHQWADPLNFAIRRYLQIAIGQAADLNIAGSLATDDGVETKIDVLVHQLHGSVSGRVVLVAEWQIQNHETEDVLAYRQFSATDTVGGDGYGEVVRAHAALLDELAESIASEIGKGD